MFINIWVDQQILVYLYILIERNTLLEQVFCAEVNLPVVAPNSILECLIRVLVTSLLIHIQLYINVHPERQQAWYKY